MGRGVYQFFRFSLSQSGPSVCTLPISIFFLFPLFSNAGLGRRGRERAVKGCKNGRKRNKGVNRERGLFRMEKRLPGNSMGEYSGKRKLKKSVCLFQSKRNGKASKQSPVQTSLRRRRQRCCCGGESGGRGAVPPAEHAAGRNPSSRSLFAQRRGDERREEEIYDGKFAKAETRYGGTAAEFATIGETPFFGATLSTRPRSKIEAG